MVFASGAFAGGCRRGPRTVSTASGTFQVPGQVRLRGSTGPGGGNAIGMGTLESGREIVGSGEVMRVDDTRVRERNGETHTLLHIASGVWAGEWIDTEMVTPADEAPARP